MRDDTAKAVKEFGVKTLFNKKSIEEAEKAILPGETVLAIQCTNFDIFSVTMKKPETHTGIFFATEKNLYFLSSIDFLKVQEIVPYNEIKAVNVAQRKAWLFLDVETATRRYSLMTTDKESKKLYPIINDAIQKVRQQTVVTKPAVQDNDIFAKIEKLADLRDRGILTEEEFQQKKKEWLSEI